MLLFSIVFIGSSFKRGEDPLVQRQLEKIHEQIKDLEKEKERYKKTAAVHQKRAASWQFNKDFSLESRREYFLAEKDLDKIHLIELKIREFEREKQELLAP